MFSIGSAWRPARRPGAGLVAWLALSLTGMPGAAHAVDAARIAGPATSEAVPFRIGDRFLGPGSITVGSLGARKQLVVPAGEWVVLSARDHDSTHRLPIRLTTVVLGRFEGAQMKSSLEAMFISKAASVGASWKEMASCEAPNKTARFQTRSQIGNVNQCAQFHLVKPRPMSTWGGAWEAVRDNLNRLEVRRDEGPGLVTRIVLADNRGGFMQLVRFDYGLRSSQPGAPEADKAFNALVEQRIDWAAAYAELAADGLGQHLQVQDLRPGVKPGPQRLALGE